ncbi:Crp/Fnr family transcriptional regulator [Chryseotalea sanaruensis]|uniref:Crp/Fnr family transcriptional regulator n=1 Tax=Chryseotalea sanaruensis TaxID=2482724 RepID=A0A401U981_9BACT|nr:Crp/Fnr family transcriptional regulator [Chryseotalea sanaruensis]GCC51442.1 Crp/Fnr family transcriptional regulator [Chryseotalea sanaruensis]
MHPLIKYFSSFAGFTSEEEKTILDSIIVKHFKKGDIVIKENDADDTTFFVVKGLVRQYKILEGNDLTINFFAENEWIISLNSFNENKTTDHFLICLEDTELITGNEESAQVLFKVFPRFETISRIVMEKTFSEKQKFLHAFQTDSPEQRYLNLVKNKPDILQRISQYYIASYLGITPESLSRIRKRMTTKKS